MRVLPSLYELAGGRIEISRLRSVELQDLLRREPISLDEEEIGAFITEKKILKSTFILLYLSPATSKIARTSIEDRKSVV